MKKLFIMTTLASFAAISWTPLAITQCTKPVLTCTYTDGTTKKIVPDPSVVTCTADCTLNYNVQNPTPESTATYAYNKTKEICEKEEPSKGWSGYSLNCE